MLITRHMEGMAMPYTVDDYIKETKEEMFKYLTKEDIDRILKMPEMVYRMSDGESIISG